MFANLVTRGLGGQLLPTAGLGIIIQVVEIPADIGDIGGEMATIREILLRVPNGHIITVVVGTLLIIDNELG